MSVIRREKSTRSNASQSRGIKEGVGLRLGALFVVASVDAEPLSIEVRGDLIIVTQRGTSFSATYGKAREEPNLVLLADTEGRDAEREVLSKFRAEAFAAATRKARELGWIV